MTRRNQCASIMGDIQWGAVMPDWLCGPHTCFMAGWLYDFQTLITGLVAAAAAIATVVVLRLQIRQERESRDEERRRERQRETDHIATVLANERDDLQRALQNISFGLYELEQAHKKEERIYNPVDPVIMKLNKILQDFHERLSETERVLRPLSIRYTEKARSTVSGIGFATMRLHIAIDKLAQYGAGFPNDLVEAEKARMNVLRVIMDLNRLDVD